MAECEDYLATKKKAFDICSSWFGKEVDTDFHRFELLLESPEAVKSAYIQHLSSPENKVTESLVMRMEYADMLKIRANHGLQSQHQGTYNRDRSTDQQQDCSNSHSLLKGSNLSDMSLNCRVCSESFVFTVQQQITNKERYNNVPTKCPDHRTPGVTHHSRYHKAFYPLYHKATKYHFGRIFISTQIGRDLDVLTVCTMCWLWHLSRLRCCARMDLLATGWIITKT